MKKNILFSLATLLALTAFSLGACKNDDDDEYNDFKANLTAAPGVTTTATGTFEADYDDDSNVLDYRISWTGLNPIAAHLHNKSNPGDIVGLNVTVGTTSPVEGSVTLDGEHEALLKAGNLYVNVHTAANPDGEIQGTVTEQ